MGSEGEWSNRANDDSPLRTAWVFSLSFCGELVGGIALDAFCCQMGCCILENAVSFLQHPVRDASLGRKGSHPRPRIPLGMRPRVGLFHTRAAVCFLRCVFLQRVDISFCSGCRDIAECSCFFRGDSEFLDHFVDKLDFRVRLIAIHEAEKHCVL